MKSKLNEKTGDMSVKCEKSGCPITRTNAYGMFCDAKVCQCEQESMQVCGTADITDSAAMLKQLFGTRFL